ncbi:hypothetical protein LTS18_004725 [Coniosporium uncinatum]|uniref:Uncharacterized protein n=1 Tax=Coniosporium uncinatum TaxID=93489 RepID=A0ACC3DYA2_9PEZI|nr:hypothetical protein LTS18_004725 [Coniosporium uncinatum]
MATRYALNVTFRFLPESVPNFLEGFKPVHRRLRKEPLLLSFDIGQSTEDPGLVRFIETWKCEPKDIMAVIQSDYFKDFLANNKTLVTEPTKVEFFKITEDWKI